MVQAQSSWKRRTIFFLISQCITLFGSQLVQMAIIWYVTLYTSSGAWVAIFSVYSYLPQFLTSFIGGAWADKYSRKWLMISADAGIAIVTLAMILLIPHISTEPILLRVLLVMSIIRSVGAGIQSPAVHAVIPQFVPKEHLMRYNGINAAMQSIVQFAAPAAAGVVLSMSTLRVTLMVDVLTAIFGIGLCSVIRFPKQESTKMPTSIFADMRMGIRYAFSHKFIGKLLIVYGLFTFLCVPAGYLSGLLVVRVYGNTYWYLTAVELVGFGGMMMGGLLMSIGHGFKNCTKTLFIGLTVFSAMAVGMGLSHNFIVYLALMALYGVALTAVQTAITTLLQETTDPTMQGRIFGFMGSMYSGCYPVGMTIFGPMADAVPLQEIMVGSGVALILIAIVARTNWI